MYFRSIIPKTFGVADFKFASHSSEVEQAIELMKICCKNDVSLKELMSAVEYFLRKNNARDDLVKEQLKEVKAKFSGWLS